MLGLDVILFVGLNVNAAFDDALSFTVWSSSANSVVFYFECGATGWGSLKNIINT